MGSVSVWVSSAVCLCSFFRFPRNHVLSTAQVHFETGAVSQVVEGMGVSDQSSSVLEAIGLLSKNSQCLH